MWPLLALVLGLAVGSFLNVVIHRLPKGESILFPPSRCPACGHRLGAIDLVPILSYLALRGRCRYCQAPISPRYPLVEGLNGALWALVALRHGPGLEALLGFLFMSLLLALAFIDLDTLELPDGLTYGLLFLGLLGAGLGGDWAQALDGALLSAGALALVAGYGGLWVRRGREARPLHPVGPHQVHLALFLGALLGPGVGMALAFLTWALAARVKRPVVLPDGLTLGAFPLALFLRGDLLQALAHGLLAAGGVALAMGLYWALRPVPEEEGELAMGYGDVKLLGALGAWVGLPGGLLALGLGAISGALVGLLLRQRVIPFGPFLALGGAVAYFFGEAIVQAYLAYLGL